MRFTLYAIRQKSTGFYLPYTEKAHSYSEPKPTKHPRLFPSYKSAAAALTQWLRGHHRCDWNSDEGLIFAGVDPVAGRVREDMEVVEMELSLKEDKCLNF